MKKQHGKHWIALVISLSLLLSLLSGCGASAKTDPGKSNGSLKVIRVGLQAEPDTLDPSDCADDGTSVLGLTTEALLRDIGGEVTPGFAESYDVEDDGKKYTFHLRDGNYSDGTPITAEDFVYTILRTLAPENAKENASLLYHIKNAEAYNMSKASAEDVGVYAEDDKTLVIIGESTLYPMIFTDHRVFIPLKQSVVESAGEAFGSEVEGFLSSGPYILKGWQHESEITMVRNDDYWNKDNIHLDEIHYMINAFDGVAADMLKTQELDACDFKDMDIINGLLADSDLADFTYESSLQYLLINLSGGNEETAKWLGNLNFRKALSAAIDRENLQKAVYPCDIVATRIMQPSKMTASGEPYNSVYPYTGWDTKANEEQAKAYLAKAIEEIGSNDIPTFSLLCYDSEANMEILSAFADMWEKVLGIKAEINAQPISGMFELMYSGDFDFWKSGSPFGTVDWLEEFGVMFQSKTGAPCFYKDPEFDRMFTAARTASTMEERQALAFELEKYICENALALCTTWQQLHFIHRSELTGITCTADGYLNLAYADLAA